MANRLIQLAKIASKALNSLTAQQRVVIPTGIEPVTYRLGICRSILLSYGTSRADT